MRLLLRILLGLVQLVQVPKQSYLVLFAELARVKRIVLVALVDAAALGERN